MDLSGLQKKLASIGQEHVLRFWETRFSTIKPLKRGGGLKPLQSLDKLEDEDVGTGYEPASGETPEDAFNRHWAQALLDLVTFIFFLGYAGTDFASLVEAFARFASEPGRAPRPLVIPHEFVAVAMAHGYYVASGRPAAVMVHVNVGTGNAATAIITASRANVPILMSAGRTPASAKAAGPDHTAPVYVRSMRPPIWCFTASPAPIADRAANSFQVSALQAALARSSRPQQLARRGMNWLDRQHG